MKRMRNYRLQQKLQVRMLGWLEERLLHTSLEGQKQQLEQK
jgi:hypothetical protein